METEPDFAMMHSALLRAPGKLGFPTDEIIPLADDLFERLPTKKLLRLCERPLQKLILSNRYSIIIFYSFGYLAISVVVLWFWQKAISQVIQRHLTGHY